MSYMEFMKTNGAIYRNFIKMDGQSLYLYIEDGSSTQMLLNWTLMYKWAMDNTNPIQIAVGQTIEGTGRAPKSVYGAVFRLKISIQPKTPPTVIIGQIVYT